MSLLNSNLLTAENAKAYWLWKSRKHKTQILSKKNSALMKSFGRILQTQGVPYSRFMNDFATTFRNRIYLPYTIGQPDNMGYYGALSQIKNCDHEHQHVVIYRRDRRYNFRYVARPQARVLYEAECLSLNMQVHWLFTGRILNHIWFHRKLKVYKPTSKTLRAADVKYGRIVRGLREGTIGEAAECYNFFNAL